MAKSIFARATQINYLKTTRSPTAIWLQLQLDRLGSERALIKDEDYATKQLASSAKSDVTRRMTNLQVKLNKEIGCYGG